MPEDAATFPNGVKGLPQAQRRASRVRFLARAAAEALQFPVVGISLRSHSPGFDLSHFLVGAVDLASDRAMCRSTMRGGDVLCIPDLTCHPVFRDSDLVTATPFLRAYAGCVLRSVALETIGAFCMFDTVPRALNAYQISLLRGFAQSAADYLNAALAQAPAAREDTMRSLVADADLAFSVGDRAEAEHLVHLAYQMFDERG